MTLRLVTIFTASLLLFGLAAYAALSAGGHAERHCTHEGREHAPGERVCRNGFAHACDGLTGAWEGLDGACDA